MSAHFTPALFAFLAELSANNNREWFEANKARYQRDVQGPMLRFIADFAPRLRELAPSFVADPRPVGGSMFRIYRDTRFSKDKTPYKTAATAHFRHAATTRDVHAPGLYLHLAPGDVMIGAGLWQPAAPALAQVRTAIVERTADWTRARQGRALWGEPLKRVPAPFPADHPHAEDLRRKDFVVMTAFDEEAVVRPDFLDRVTAGYADLAPFQRFLTTALGLPY